MNGKITIPADLRRLFKLEDEVEIIVTDNGLLLVPYNSHAKCMVTGKVTDDLKVYSGGIILSDEGRDILLCDILDKRQEEE